jgi:hypothetical protein
MPGGANRSSGKGAAHKLRDRTARDDGLLREVRWQLSRNAESAARVRRLERMERTARLWVNGEELGDPRFAYLAEVHD